MPRKTAPPPPDDDDDDDEVEATDRDFVMARLAAGRSAAADAVALIDEALSFMLVPHDDAKGKARKTAISDALEALGVATRAMECAEENADEYDPTEGEPWDVEDDDDEEDDDEDGE